MKQSKQSYIFVTLSILIWGATPAVAKLLLKNLDNFQILFFSSLVAIVCLFIINTLQNKLNLIKTYELKDYANFAFMGFVGIFINYTFLYSSLSYSTVQEAYIVYYTWPVWTMIWSTLLLKEKINLVKICAIILGFLGVYISASKGDVLSLQIANPKSILFALIASISYGLFSAQGKKFHYDKTSSILMYFIFGFVTILIYTLS